ncbi:MAG: ABC transporter permease [Anaerolineales bacterium]|nr:ABC transporter permease [Anaerolineales bacterium]
MTDTDLETTSEQAQPSLLSRIWKAISIPVVAVLLALIVSAVILILSGSNPLLAYAALFQGAFGSLEKFGRTLEKATPLIFTGLAVAFAFKAGLFNIGAQGQLIFGAMTAAIIGFGIDGLPSVIHIPLALIGGAIAGGLYGAIPGVLKVYTGAHEVITTIMLNFIALNITDYLADGPLKDNSPGNIVARTPLISEAAEIPAPGGIPIGFFIAVVVAIIIWWVLGRTILGFEIRTVGLNPNAARYAGIRVAATVIITMVISGVLAGLGGAVETLGIIHRFQPAFNVGLGFDGITVALLGKTNPLGVVPAAVLIGALKAGSSQMQLIAGVPKEITEVIQALILFFVAADAITRWVLRTRETDEDRVVLTTGWGKS